MSFVFGKDIEFKFIPLAGNVPVRADTLVSARLYSVEPTEAQKMDAGLLSTGHIGARITSWLDAGDFEKTIIVPAVTDPNPFNGAEWERYYLSINFRYQNGGPECYTTEQIIIYRAGAITSRISTDITAVIAIDSNLGKHLDANKISIAINKARKDVIDRYYSLGYDLRKLFDLESLNEAVAYRAAARLFMELYTERTPHWLDKYKEAKAEYESLFQRTPVAYDATGNGRIPPEQKESTGVVWPLR